jgi:hypothetical protein
MKSLRPIPAPEGRPVLLARNIEAVHLKSGKIILNDESSGPRGRLSNAVVAAAIWETDRHPRAAF